MISFLGESMELNHKKKGLEDKYCFISKSGVYDILAKNHENKIKIHDWLVIASDYG